MEHREEKYARDLYDKLERRFAPVSSQTEITLSGRGVQWRCLAKRGRRSALVHCFDTRNGPDLLTLLKEEEKELAAGRTPSPIEAVDAIWHWLDFMPLDGLYANFKFIDWQKRELARIRDFVMKDFPDVGITAPSELTYWGSAIHHLWFRTETRSSHLHFYGKGEFPQAVFHWDQCELFCFKADDPPVLGAVLTRWLCDSALPSTMRKEFPTLEIGELADYYENGNPVEGEFIQSWDRMEQFYGSEHFPLKRLVLPFLAQLRRAGYDHKLRAGQSMWTFVLSRSRRHGMRGDQSHVRFEFQPREGTMDVLCGTQTEERISGIAIALSNPVEEALARLVSQPIS
jgi:hypothetical protein